jgi:cytochrome P450
MNAAFSPVALSAVTSTVESFVEELTDRIKPHNEVEFVSQVAAIVPIKTLCLLLGLPEEDHNRVFDWTNKLVGASDPEYSASLEDSMKAFMEVFQYGREQIESRRKEPRDDLLSLVASITKNGTPLEGAERDAMFTLLLAAGNETTRNSLTGSILALTKFPDQREELASDLSLMDNAIEELLRYVTPVIHMMRIAREDVEIGSEVIREGQRVTLLYGAGNHDPELFEDPHALRLNRENARKHIAFGVGIHHCLGARLARIQLKALLTALLTKFPNVQAVSEPEYLQSNFVSAVKRVQVRLH